MATLTARFMLERIWSEKRRLVSFFFIGLSTLGLNLGLYALFSRVLWPDGPRTLEYAVVVVLATLFNFEANRHFTFNAAKRSWNSAARFGFVAIFAMVFNNFLFWFGHAVLRLNDFAVIVFISFVIAFLTFSCHRLFTFHPDPWRHLRGLRRPGRSGGQPLQ